MGGVLKSVTGALWGDQPEPDFTLANMKRPDRIKYKGLTTEEGDLLDKFKLSNGADYENIAKGRLSQNISKGRDEAAKSGAGAAAQARNAMASRGGLSGGAAALLARQQMTDQSGAQQGLTQQDIGGQQDIGEKTWDIGREAEKFNLGNQIGDVGRRQSFNEGMYGQDMSEWGASQTADAMRKNAPRPKGGVLGGITSGLGGIMGKG